MNCPVDVEALAKSVSYYMNITFLFMVLPRYILIPCSKMMITGPQEGYETKCQYFLLDTVVSNMGEVARV